MDELKRTDEEAGVPAKGSETVALLDRAIAGDPTCKKRLNALLDDHDRAGRIVERFGNLSHYPEQKIIDELAGKSLLIQATVERKMDKLKAELAGPDPTPIERLLAERAAYCWLVLWRYELALAQAKDLSFQREEFHNRRIDAAHRRYLSSLRTLAQIRKLALPAVQVNIGGNQVNVAGT